MAPPAFEGHLNYGIPANPRGPTEWQVMTYQGTMWRLRCSDVSWQTCQAGFSPRMRTWYGSLGTSRRGCKGVLYGLGFGSPLRRQRWRAVQT